MNRTYHPHSWSEQARRIANNLYNLESYYFNEFKGQELREAVNDSYHNPIVINRVAKRLHRLVHKYN